tara:strand:- start:451 stop:696 length:246 start_codon:yes stop_codon:yes gene_type:complete
MVHEVDIKRVVRGPADLEERIDQLQKQKELLKFHCKKSGEKIKDLERIQEISEKEIDRLSEENENLRVMMGRTGAPVDEGK